MIIPETRRTRTLIQESDTMRLGIIKAKKTFLIFGRGSSRPLLSLISAKNSAWPLCRRVFHCE